MDLLGTTLHFETISHCGPQLHLSFRFSGGVRFTTTIWYDFSLNELDVKFGSSFMEEIYFHCAMFEMNKLCSLHPSLKLVDLGPWACFHTEKLETFWRILTINGFGEWRFLNNLPDWKGPQFSNDEMQGKKKNPVVTIDSTDTTCLVFCGGGKDSLVSMKLLESIGESYGSLSYSHSIYGQSESQHEMIDSLLDHCSPVRRHHLRIYDDFLSLPVVDTLPGLEVTSVKSQETYSSIFEALPVALKYGYTELCLGHERSANQGNLVWSVNGEEISHQWVKSFKAESLVRSYIKEVLVSNISFYSTLQPIYDSLIFAMLSHNPEAVPFTQSCNFQKPWCLRCPKCCYVWLGYKAYLSEEVVLATFHTKENLLDVEENQSIFIQMLGLGDQVPFECGGQHEEVQLAFALCDAKGIMGKAMNVFREKIVPSLKTSKKGDIIAKYLSVYTSNIGVPERIASKYLEKLEEYSTMAKSSVFKN